MTSSFGKDLINFLQPIQHCKETRHGSEYYNTSNTSRSAHWVGVSLAIPRAGLHAKVLHQIHA